MSNKIDDLINDPDKVAQAVRDSIQDQKAMAKQAIPEPTTLPIEEHNNPISYTNLGQLIAELQKFGGMDKRKVAKLAQEKTKHYIAPPTQSYESAMADSGNEAERC